MADRTVVSYDDITLPYDDAEMPPPASKPSAQPPAKKRKKNNQKGKHWDTSGGPKSASTSNSQRDAFLNRQSGPSAPQRQDAHLQGGEDVWDAGDEEGDGEGEYEDEESRDLTHEEIWDDSALVDAWESAMEEYKAYHGGADAWKREPVKKSPLWYNVPVDPSKKPADAPLPSVPAVVAPTFPAAAAEDAEGDSQPLNFDTFVPTHDTTLERSDAPANPVAADYIPDTPAGPMVSQDEAFSRAMSAMYWGGYWTAMYHAQRHASQLNPTTTATPVEDIEVEDDDDIEVDDDLEDFTPTQR